MSIRSNPQPRLDLAVLKFWCSVIDFYGGLYYVRSENKTQKSFGKFTLAKSTSFISFIKKYFPKPECEYGDIIYKVFRSGVVHQLAPKRSAIHWQHPTIHKLFWLEIEKDEAGQTISKLAHINLNKFAEYSYTGF